MLTPAQDTTLATAIRADTNQAVIDALAARQDSVIASLYNVDSTFVVWRTSVPALEYREALDWTEVDNLTVGKARIWEWITQNMTIAFNPSKNNVRAGLNNAFGGSTNTKAALTALAKRYASKFEALFATGTGTDATPGDLVVQGPLSHTDVSRALNNNP